MYEVSNDHFEAAFKAIIERFKNGSENVGYEITTTADEKNVFALPLRYLLGINACRRLVRGDRSGTVFGASYASKVYSDPKRVPEFLPDHVRNAMTNLRDENTAALVNAVDAIDDPVARGNVFLRAAAHNADPIVEGSGLSWVKKKLYNGMYGGGTYIYHGGAFLYRTALTSRPWGKFFGAT